MRGTTAVRLVVYGFVVVIALLVWQVRTHHRPATPAAKQSPRGSALLGSTSGGSPITAHVKDGRLGSVAVTVRSPCEDVPSDVAVPLTIVNELDPGERQFEATRKAQYRTDASGWQAELTVSVRGELAADGKRASGTASTWITWLRNGVAGQTCQPSSQTWEATRP